MFDCSGVVPGGQHARAVKVPSRFPNGFAPQYDAVPDITLRHPAQSACFMGSRTNFAVIFLNHQSVDARFERITPHLSQVQEPVAALKRRLRASDGPCFSRRHATNEPISSRTFNQSLKPRESVGWQRPGRPDQHDRSECRVHSRVVRRSGRLSRHGGTGRDTLLFPSSWLVAASVKDVDTNAISRHARS